MSPKRQNGPLLRTTDLEEAPLVVVIRKHLSRKKYIHNYSDCVDKYHEKVRETEASYNLPDLRSYDNSQSPREHVRWPLVYLPLQPGVLSLERTGRPLASSSRAEPLCTGPLGCWLCSQNWAQIHEIWDRCLCICVCVYVCAFLFYHFLKPMYTQYIHTIIKT